MAININFNILDETIEPKQIVLIDTSDWGEIIDSPAVIDIVAPGYTKEVSFPFNKGEVTVITAKTLGLQNIECQYDDDLADGVYKITVTGSPDNYYREKYFLKSDIIRLKLDKLIVAFMDSCNKLSQYNKDMFVNIYFLIMSARAQVRLGNWCKANELYKEAERLISNMNCYGV